MLKTKRELKEKTTEDVRFYLSSCIASAETMLNIVRKHWQVENTLHWTLDVTFREDESRIRKDAGPENYAIMVSRPNQITPVRPLLRTVHAELPHTAPDSSI